jgi:hypothetical protein
MLLFAAASLVAACSAPVNTNQARPANGWVDLHAHPMSYLGFGGKLISGGVDESSLLPADAHCNALVRSTSMLESLGNENAIHGGYGLDNTCGNSLRNWGVGTFESALGAWKEGDRSRGAPDFRDWPRWDDLLHQKMWIDWIRRAYDQKQRVMVALAVNNKTLADVFAGSPSELFLGGGDAIPRDDKGSADLQIENMKELVARHDDFMEIAYSSSDLRSILEKDKLAIVLGVEIDNIGNLKKTLPNTSPKTVRAELDRLWDLGVRYVFPVHVIDNPFGGTAAYQDLFNISNLLEEGSLWSLECSPPEDLIEFRAGETLDAVESLTSSLPDFPGRGVIEGGVDAAVEHVDGALGPECGTRSDGTRIGHRNKRGLTTLGELAITYMMQKGFFIDIDHMSQASANRTIELAQALATKNPNSGVKGYPLMSGHNGIRGHAGTPGANGSSENQRTPAQLKALAGLHGMFGLGSSKLSARTWMADYAIAMTTGGFDDGAVCFGTDLDGLVHGNPPPDDASSVYGGSLAPQTTGTRTWNYDRDGVAHYGMLGEFIADARRSDPNDYVNSSLMASAQYFMDTWVVIDQARTVANVGSGAAPCLTCWQACDACAYDRASCYACDTCRSSCEVLKEKPPRLESAPRHLTFTSYDGTAPGAQQLVVRNTGVRSLAWTATTDDARVHIDPSSGVLRGTSAQTLTVTVDAQAFPEVRYQSFAIDSDYGSAAGRVDVTFKSKRAQIRD